MPRYFLEVAYDGECYAGFQKQANANTIQAEVEKALSLFFRYEFNLTGSSRTDAGVHAFQNFFHFDTPNAILVDAAGKVIYHLNAILPLDIVVKNITEVEPDAHCRFDAVSRTYNYQIYQEKNPFLSQQAYYYPYGLDLRQMKIAAQSLFSHSDYEAFSKRSTQVHTFLCQMKESDWVQQGDLISYRVTANRFLRGMVRGLVGTMLLVGRGKLSTEDFVDIIISKNSSRVNFAVPAHGLTLMGVSYPLA